MTVTPADVADLMPGDTLTVSGQGATLSGTVSAYNGALYLTPYCVVRDASGQPFPGMTVDTMTVNSRAPRPLYVNCTRTAAVKGDVARDAQNDADPNSYANTGTSWCVTGASTPVTPPTHLRLLIDGATGHFAPQ